MTVIVHSMKMIVQHELFASFGKQFVLQNKYHVHSGVCLEQL